MSNFAVGSEHFSLAQLVILCQEAKQAKASTGEDVSLSGYWLAVYHDSSPSRRTSKLWSYKWLVRPDTAAELGDHELLARIDLETVFVRARTDEFQGVHPTDILIVLGDVTNGHALIMMLRKQWQKFQIREVVTGAWKWRDNWLVRSLRRLWFALQVRRT